MRMRAWAGRAGRLGRGNGGPEGDPRLRQITRQVAHEHEQPVQVGPQP